MRNSYTMRGDDTYISMIDQWSDKMDDMWAQVLNETFDDDDEANIVLRRKPEELPPSKLDQTLVSALKLVDNEKIEGLGCFLNSMLLSWTPEEEEAYGMMRTRPKGKKGRDLGLPPRPEGLPRIRTKLREEKRQEDTKEDGGFLSYIFGGAVENEEREQSHSSSTDVDMKGVNEMATVPLIRKISFKRVSSSFRRAAPAPTPDPVANEHRKDETEDYGIFSFMLGEGEDQQEETRQDLKGRIKTKINKKKEWSNTERDSSDSMTEVRLVRRTSSRKDGEGWSVSSRRLQTEHF